ncbi:hypothetical protein DPMN_136413 [Dreissena polymorpha]|uniref:Uncharacterized protein n=1 Tax=Dreissena polymorpha TaxID=45954 RepID=A0A9D4G2R0_DREPO|nr:hypothetical protein DPMN_136413 [Dreissena polymorpha]
MVCYVACRSNQCWEGLRSDLVIEQRLMRSSKNTSGLTRSSGTTKEMENLWALSALVTSECNTAMQDLTDLTYTTCPQHKYSHEAGINRYASYPEKVQTNITI